MKVDVETLVGLVVARAVVDKTAPDSTNLRNGWRTDALLVGDVDAFVVIQLNDPAVYAEIGRRVFAKVGDMPAMAALARLAIFRGERLLPIDPEREQALVRMAEELERAISDLPDGTRKMRLLSLLKYHQGVFFDACGRFDLAARMQAQSAEEAVRLGDQPGAAIARFCEVLYRLKNALRKDKTELVEECYSSMEEMEEVFTQVTEATRGSTLQVQWAEGNCPLGMVEACVWLDRVHPGWENWVKTTLAASSKLGEAFKSSAEFVRAVDMAFRSDPKADEALNAAADSNDVDERRATALLVLARRAMHAGKRDVAENIVSRMPEKGAQHVCAIARRMLASE